MNPESKPKPIWQALKNYFWLNFACLFAIFLAYGRFHALNFTVPVGLYFTALSFAQAGLFCLVLLFALPALAYFLSARRLAPLYFALPLGIVLLAFMASDLALYSTMRSHWTGNLLQIIFNRECIQILSISPLELCIAAGTGLALLLFQFGLYWLSQNFALAAQGFKRRAPFLMLLALLVSQGIYLWADALYQQPYLLVSELSPGFRGITAKRFLLKQQWIKPVSEPVKLQATAAKLQYPLRPLQQLPLKHKPNILLIGIDTWRFDALGPDKTPNLLRLLSESSYYKQHYSGGDCTQAGIFSLFYSVSPNDFYAFYNQGRGPLLFDSLYQQGYKVAAYTSATATAPPFYRNVFLNVKGFETDTPGTDSVERDQAITDRSMAFIHKAKQDKQPFFVFAFYDSVHAYRFPSKNFKPPFPSEAQVRHFDFNRDPEFARLHVNLYYNALYYVDALIGKLIADLKAEGLYEDTLIIVTGDHGEEFNDNGFGLWGHNSDFTPVQTKVPLIVHWPGQKQPEQIDYASSHYDIVPTLMQKYLAVQNPTADYSLGYRLEDGQQRRLVLMGSYGRQAFFAPELGLIAVSDRLGFLHSENLKGQAIPDQHLPADLMKLAFEQMYHFHRK